MADENETQENETQELPDLPQGEAETPKIVPVAAREPVQAVQSANAKGRAEERKADREAGRNSVLEALNKKAQAAGFDTVDEFLKAGINAKAPPRPADKTQADAELRRENASLQKTIQGLRSRISVLENDMELRKMAYESDIEGDEVDYALHTLHSHYRKLPDAEAKAFDPQKFLREDLKAKKPNIFRKALQAAEEKKTVEEVAVNSTPTGGRPVGPPASSVRDQEVQETRPKNVMQMPRAEYLAYLASKGMSNPAKMV